MSVINLFLWFGKKLKRRSPFGLFESRRVFSIFLFLMKRLRKLVSFWGWMVLRMKLIAKKELNLLFQTRIEMIDIRELLCNQVNVCSKKIPNVGWLKAVFFIHFVGSTTLGTFELTHNASTHAWALKTACANNACTNDRKRKGTWTSCLGSEPDEANDLWPNI